jgi:type IV pilus assembly protein PilM
MAFALNKIFSQLKQLKKEPVVSVKGVTGIDFGASSVKIVDVQLLDEVLTLKTYGELQLGPYLQQDLGASVDLPIAKRIEALIDVIREAEAGARNGVLALPLSGSFVTIIPIEAKKQEDISSRVPVEARKYIPVPITDVQLEWTEVTAAQHQEGDPRDVLIAAIQNETITEMNALMSAIQLVSQPAEIEIFSALRALAKAEDTSIAIIDIGARTSKLYIANNGIVHRIHRVQVGGSNATAAIAARLNISFSDAEKKKRLYAPEDSNAEEIKKTMAQTFDRVFEEFKRVISQYEMHSGAPIPRIVLTGGASTFYDFLPYAQYHLDHAVERANPFTKVAYPAFLEDTIAEIGPLFSVALGAALRPFEG